jgi:hypothetical protein
MQDLPISGTGKNRKFFAINPLIINANLCKSLFPAHRKLLNIASIDASYLCRTNVDE